MGFDESLRGARLWHGPTSGDREQIAPLPWAADRLSCRARQQPGGVSPGC